jgi:hypothetical protein
MTNYDMRGQSVINQFNAETINIISAEAKRLSRITWRGVETVNYIVKDDSKRFKIWFAQDIFKSIMQTFTGKGYKRFSAILDPRSAKVGGQTSFAYRLHCHEVAFVSNIRKFVTERSALYERVNSASSPEEQERLLREEADDRKHLFEGWRISPQIDSSQLGAIRIEYDPDGHSVSVMSLQPLSLDPQHYDHRVETTSEMLEYVAAALQSPVAFVGDLTLTQQRNVPLLKLTASLLDGEPIKIDSIRINAKDWEQWDYRYPLFEAELARLK